MCVLRMALISEAAEKAFPYRLPPPSAHEVAAVAAVPVAREVEAVAEKSRS